MLNSILQSLAEMMVGETALTTTEQIDFNPPSSISDSSRDLSLNLYLYDIRASRRMPISGKQVERRFDRSQPVANIRRAPSWFDVSILITARDRTIFGEHRLLTEVLSLLMRNQSLREEFLPLELRGHGNLPLSATGNPPIDVISLWNSLSLPIRPAVYLTVTLPLDAWQKVTVPLVTERRFGVYPSPSESDRGSTVIRSAVISGIVKNVLTSKPLRRVHVELQGTEKSVTSNEEGYFFFENLSVGSYVLQIRRFGYQTQTHPVSVNKNSSVLQEILLMPS